MAQWMEKNMQELAPWFAIFISLGSLLVALLSWRSSAKVAAIEEKRIASEEEKEASTKRVRVAILEFQHDNEGPGPQTHALLELSPPLDESVIAFNRIEIDGKTKTQVDVHLESGVIRGPTLNPVLRIVSPQRVAITVHHLARAGETAIRLMGEREDARRSQVLCDILIPE
jgi:hypothetical protein